MVVSWGESLRDCLKMSTETAQLLHVQRGEFLESARAVFTERETNNAVIVSVSRPFNQSRRGGAIDQADCRVMSQQQIVGDFANRGSSWVVVPSNSEEQLMLSGREADRVRLLFAPTLKETHAGSNTEESSVNLIGEFHVPSITS